MSVKIIGMNLVVSRLWGAFCSMNGRAKVRLPIMEQMSLQMGYNQVEDAIIQALFPHAITDSSTFLPYPIINIDHPLPELISPFTLGELQAAISQGKPKSALGHDKVKLQDLRNLPPHGLDAPLHLANHSWESVEIPDSLKITVIHPTPKPCKDPRHPQNLRPIALAL